MRLIVASANVDEVREAYEFYAASGVATNPSVLAREKGDPLEILRGVRDVIGNDDLHVQVLAQKASGMLADARRITDVLGKETLVKVPVTREGLKAIGELSRQGFRVTATAVYTAAQGYMAALAGAEYVAPYVGRTDNMGFDGIEVARELKCAFDASGGCKVFAASVKSVRQLVELAQAGIDAVTPDMSLIRKTVDLREVDGAVAAFEEDFARVFGRGRTMADF